MSETPGQSDGASAEKDAWSRRWWELSSTLPRVEPTDDETFDAQLDLIQRVLPLAASPACHDDTLGTDYAGLFDDPEALAMYARVHSRLGKINSILAAEGLEPPDDDDSD